MPRRATAAAVLAAAALLGSCSAPVPPADPEGQAARPAGGAGGAAAARRPAGSGFRLVFDESFDTPVPLGAFSDCNHNANTAQAYCGGLTGRMRADWWAYPDHWPDTATQRGFPVGGYYDPATTLWVSRSPSGDGELHIRLWRGAGGPVHSATVVPKPMIGIRYGAFEERWRVTHIAPGYKSAHLLTPMDNAACPNCEVDFPEGEWDGTIYAYAHHKDEAGGAQDGFATGAGFGQWHTTRIEWTPGDVKFFLDGRLVGESTTAVPDTPAQWDIQNEAALTGPSAAPNTWAQLDITSVRGWSWS